MMRIILGIISLLALTINVVYFVQYLCTGQFNFDYLHIVSLYIGTISSNLFCIEFAVKGK